MHSRLWQEILPKGDNILAESSNSAQDTGGGSDDEPYDMAADIADDVAGGGRSILIAVITTILDDEKFHAYIDDSTSADGAIACSAGYLFEPRSSREFRTQWKPFLESKGMPYFHATDDIRRPDEEAKEIFSTLAKLTKRTAYRGLVNFIPPSSVTSLHESIRGYVGSVFSAATLGCMKSIAEIAKEQKRSVVYFIENQLEFGGELRDFLNQIKASPQLIEDFAMAGADTYEKRDVIQLQAADLFAWSFGRSHYRNGWIPEIIELMQDRAIRHTMVAFDPMMLSLINSSRGMRSNRKYFDQGKNKRKKRTK